MAESERIVGEARRRFHRHNAGRRFVEAELFAALARSSREDAVDVRRCATALRRTPEVREALEWMWPVLTPAQLLHDLFGSRALLRNAGAPPAVRRRVGGAGTGPRAETVDEVGVDQRRRAAARRGPRPARPQAPSPPAGADAADDEVRTYGHIVVDEAQDLSPMQLRMLERRSLNGSMTIVGDIAQSTGEWAHANWQEILDHLPDRRPARRAELTVGYRLPAPNMALAVAGAGAWPTPTSRRPGRSARTASRPASCGPTPTSWPTVVVAGGRRRARGGGHRQRGRHRARPRWSTRSATPSRWPVVEFGRATRHGLDAQITVVPVGLVKGLELDASVVVEPAAIVDEEAQGLRALYVALTRATKRLAIVHAADLPEALQE